MRYLVVLVLVIGIVGQAQADYPALDFSMVVEYTDPNPQADATGYYEAHLSCSIAITRAAGASPVFAYTVSSTTWWTGTGTNSYTWTHSLVSVTQPWVFTEGYHDGRTAYTWTNYGTMAPGTYTLHIIMQNTIAQHLYDVSLNFSEENLEAEGGQGGTFIDPPPDPGEGGESADWWTWFTSIFTLDASTSADWATWLGSWSTIGPWGDTETIGALFSADSSPNAIMWPTTWLAPGIYGVRYTPGNDAGRQFYPINNAEGVGIPGLTNCEVGGFAGGSQPWLNVTTLWGWREVFRTLMGYAVWVLAIMSVLMSVKGRWVT